MSPVWWLKIIVGISICVFLLCLFGAELILALCCKKRPNYTLRDIIILPIIFALETFFLIEEFEILNDLSFDFEQIIWFIIVCEMELVLFWFLHQRTVRSVPQLVLQVLSTTASVLYIWIFINLLLFSKGNTSFVGYLLNIIFVSQAIFAGSLMIINFCANLRNNQIQNEIHQNLMVTMEQSAQCAESPQSPQSSQCSKSSKSSKSQRPSQSLPSNPLIGYLVNFMLLAICVLGILGRALNILNVSIASIDDLDLFDLFVLIYRICIFICCVLMIVMIRSRGEPDESESFKSILKGSRFANIGVTVIGPAGIGKSNLIRSIANLNQQQNQNRMNELYKIWDVKNTAKYRIWTTVGKERFNIYTIERMCQSQAIVFVIRKDDPQSMKFIEDLHNQVQRLFPKEQTFSCFVIVLNGGINQMTHYGEYSIEDSIEEIKWPHLIHFHICEVLHLKVDESKGLVYSNKLSKENNPVRNEILSKMKVTSKSGKKCKWRIPSKDRPFLIRNERNERENEYPMMHRFTTYMSHHDSDNKSEDFNMLDSNVSHDSNDSHGLHQESHHSCESTNCAKFNGPLGSAHYWKLKRRFRSMILRFVMFILFGCLVPLLSVMQTCIFLMYTDEWGGDFEAINLDLNNLTFLRGQTISKNFAFLLDLFYPFFPRENPDPREDRVMRHGLRSFFETTKKNKVDFDAYFRQTFVQKVGRISLTLAIVVLATFIVYNVISLTQYNISHIKEVSTWELMGGAVALLAIWLLIASWFANKVEIEPDMSDLFEKDKLKQMKIRYKLRQNDNEPERSNLDLFLQAYKYYYRRKPIFGTPKIKTIIMVIVSLIYAVAPGIYRIFINQLFFTQTEYFDAARGMIVNFVIASLAMYLFDRGFYEYFRQYEELMTKITELIEINKKTNQKTNNNDENTTNTQKHDGYDHTAFQFLSFDDPQNFLSWMELRSLAYVRGKKLFAELELFIVVCCFLLLAEALWLFFKLFINNDYTSQSMIPIIISFIVIGGLLARVAILGFKFDSLQRRQINALTNQTFCIRSEALSQNPKAGPEGWQKFSLHYWIYQTNNQNINDQSSHKQDKTQLQLNNDDNMMIPEIITIKKQTMMNDDTRNDNNDKQINNDVTIHHSSDHGSNDSNQMNDNNDSNNSIKWMLRLNQYLGMLELAQKQLVQQSINPALFGLSLNGALMITLVSAVGGSLVALLSTLFKV